MTLPSWITLDSANSRLVGAAGQFSGTTQAEANASAQRSLDTFGDAAIADGSLYCNPFPVLETTIAGFGADAPAQSTWDEDNEFVWTSWGYNGSVNRPVSRLDVNDNSIATFLPTFKTHGVQYVPDYSPTGTLQGERVWFNRVTKIGHILPAAPYTETNVFTSPAVTGNLGNTTGPALWVPEENMLFVAQGIVSDKLRFSRIDFMTGVRTESDLIVGANGVNTDTYNYTYNPEQSAVLAGQRSPGIASVNISSLAATFISLAGGRNTRYCHAYCPDNGYIYAAYVLGGIYGVALIKASDYSILDYVDIDSTFITGIVYHPFRRYMYVYGSTKVTIIDTDKYALGSAMILGNITTGLTSSISRATGVYSPTTRKVYIANPAGSMYVIT